MQAFGACLQRTRLCTFLWTQPLLLVPALWMGRAHCTSQLGSAPDAAAHLQRIAATMQRCTAWLPVGPVGGAAGAPPQALAPEPACLATHFWLVLALSFCLPAIMIHRLEGQEEAGGPVGEDAQKRQEALAPGGRKLLLQKPPSLLSSAAELLLAGYAAWLVTQVVLPLLAR